MFLVERYYFSFEEKSELVKGARDGGDEEEKRVVSERTRGSFFSIAILNED